MSSASRREVILEAAKALFATQGYGGTSIDDVATAAGVTKPVIYDHFASKRDLYVAIMRRLRDTLLQAGAEALTTEATPRERFRGAIESFFLQVKRDPAIVPLLFVQPRTHPELMHEWARLQAEALTHLRPLVAALAPSLDRWQLDVAVSFLHHGLNATAEVWPRRVSIEDMTELLVTLMWKGVGSVSAQEFS